MEAREAAPSSTVGTDAAPGLPAGDAPPHAIAALPVLVTAVVKAPFEPLPPALPAALPFRLALVVAAPGSELPSPPRLPEDWWAANAAPQAYVASITRISTSEWTDKIAGSSKR